MPEFLAHASLGELFCLVFAFFAGLTVVSVTVGFAAERGVPNRRIMALPTPPGQRKREVVGNAVFVSVTTVAFAAALASGWVRFGDGLLRGVATFFALMFGFQIFYWGLHRAMHTKALLWAHRWHHTSQVTSALSAQSVSVVEACLWMLGYVGLPLALSLAFPIGFWGWAAYMAFNVYGNIVGHANVELSAKPGASRFMTLFANPWVYHALHHARWNGHYAFQAALMDRIFKTELEDWPLLFAKVLRGEPLESLKERGVEPQRP